MLKHFLASLIIYVCRRQRRENSTKSAIVYATVFFYLRTICTFIDSQNGHLTLLGPHSITFVAIAFFIWWPSQIDFHIDLFGQVVFFGDI